VCAHEVHRAAGAYRPGRFGLQGVMLDEFSWRVMMLNFSEDFFA
jgi:hypothetical protein